MARCGRRPPAAGIRRRSPCCGGRCSRTAGTAPHRCRLGRAASTRSPPPDGQAAFSPPARAAAHQAVVPPQPGPQPDRFPPPTTANRQGNRRRRPFPWGISSAGATFLLPAPPARPPPARGPADEGRSRRTMGGPRRIHQEMAAPDPRWDGRAGRTVGPTSRAPPDLPSPSVHAPGRPQPPDGHPRQPGRRPGGRRGRGVGHGDHHRRGHELLQLAQQLAARPGGPAQPTRSRRGAAGRGGRTVPGGRRGRRRGRPQAGPGRRSTRPGPASAGRGRCRLVPAGRRQGRPGHDRRLHRSGRPLHHPRPTARPQAGMGDLVPGEQDPARARRARRWSGSRTRTPWSPCPQRGATASGSATASNTRGTAAGGGGPPAGLVPSAQVGAGSSAVGMRAPGAGSSRAVR